MKSAAIRAGAVAAIALVLISVLATSAAAAPRSPSGLHGGKGHWAGSLWRQGGHWHRHWRGGYWHRGWGWYPAGFVVGYGFGAALARPWWGYPRVYAPVAVYPAYPYPAYAYPPPAVPYSYPAYPPPPPPPPAPEPGAGSPGSSAPLAPTPELHSSLTAPGPGVEAPPGVTTESPVASPPAGGTACETVTVMGHWQTRVHPDGQRVAVWVPTRSTCR